MQECADAVVRSIQRLGRDLISQVPPGEQNLCLSAWSIGSALAMARLGAGARAAAELDSLLQLDDTRIRSGFATLLEQLRPGSMQDYESEAEAPGVHAPRGESAVDPGRAHTG